MCHLMPSEYIITVMLLSGLLQNAHLCTNLYTPQDSNLRIISRWTNSFCSRNHHLSLVLNTFILFYLRMIYIYALSSYILYLFISYVTAHNILIFFFCSRLHFFRNIYVLFSGLGRVGSRHRKTAAGLVSEPAAVRFSSGRLIFVRGKSNSGNGSAGPR